MRAGVELVVASSNDNLKQAEVCAWIGGAITTVFREREVINSFVDHKGDCSGRFLIRPETYTGVFGVSSILVKN